MAFYIKPPGGVETLPNMAAYCRKRLLFLRQVLGCDGIAAFRRLVERPDTADESECLIEGSSKDRVSHFLLRLACCQDSEMAAFLVRAETELFCHRFASMSGPELTRLLQTTHRFLARLHRLQARQRLPLPAAEGRGRPPGGRTACRDLLTVLQGMLAGGPTTTWAQLVDKYLDGCRSQFVRVPFEQAASLVARRAVTLERGLAEVPVADILKLLAPSFERIVAEGLADARLSVGDALGGEERVRWLFRELRQTFYRHCRVARSERVSAEALVAGDVIDELSSTFPPCMRHLHKMLRRKHRLRHFSRIQYTLFLKEVGLPVAEAVLFWQREYSQPEAHQSGSGASCCHSWKRDGRRYTYSIRHLYGLEGSRVDYRAHSCRSLQDCSLGHGEEGGCPFQHFDDSHLRTMMSEAGIASEEDQREVGMLAARGKAQEACHAFYRKSAAASLCAATAAKQVKRDASGENFKVASSDDGVDSNFQPPEKKKKRARVDDSCGPGEACHAETGPGDFGKELPAEPSVARDTLWPTTPRGNRNAFGAPDPDSVGAFRSDTSGEAGSTTEGYSSEHPARKASREVSEERSPGQVSEDDASAPSNARELGACSHRTDGLEATPSRSFRPVDDLWSPGGMLEASLKDLYIQKPVDFYRSYTQLLASLGELEGDKS